ncbi:MAG: D-alanyl-D-alanine carboxypeptidase [Synechococcaceae cyanobacterium RL_1_2]|nr:D-alanyl-D-alanine carboxypeptidase [Synechococcaceae cyanobacterium RL_1_2]
MWGDFTDHQGTQTRSAASLTKVATTIAVLTEFEPDYRFTTEIYGVGQAINGTWQGDLIINSEGNPMMVWEEGFALAHGLEDLGIKRIEGNLIVVGNLFMNYQSDPQVAGNLLKQSFNSNNWPPQASQVYGVMASKLPKPQLAITGQVKLSDQLPANSKLLLSHKSLKLQEIIRQMNIHSNNKIAEMLADRVGGGPAVAQTAATLTQVPPGEIKLINGSGLGVDNRISPRAACGMFLALEKQLQPYNLTVGDLFPVGNKDRNVGTMEDRRIPPGVAIKTGTLREVSALAGLIPDQERGSVCFAIINGGSGKIPYLRGQQDNFLQNLTQNWTIEDAFLDGVPSEQLGDRDRLTLF